ncbi:MAG: glycoside hydrolase family 108 protein [Flavobacteriaceae bacterium]
MKQIKDFIRISKTYGNEFVRFRDVFFPQTMKWEGGSKLHKVKGDSGGWTKWGIAWNFWERTFKDFNDFKDTTKEEAAAFAFVKFYIPIRAESMPDDSKYYYFDTAYNMGTYRAIKIMQKCAGVKQDGKIGPITISRMHLVSECSLRIEREKFYNRLAAKKHILRKFLRGWLNRSKGVYDFKY